MLVMQTTAGLIGSALLASVAFAQTPTATTDRANMAPAATSDSSFQGNWRASKVVGLSVYNDNNESLGSINDLLTDKSGNSVSTVVGTACPGSVVVLWRSVSWSTMTARAVLVGPTRSRTFVAKHAKRSSVVPGQSMRGGACPSASKTPKTSPPCQWR